MIIKICGMRAMENIQAISQLPIHAMGFIFYDASIRYVGEQLNLTELKVLRKDLLKIGVFVNQPIVDVLAKVKYYGLNAVQLHGEETPSYCQQLKAQGVKVWKAFQIQQQEDFNNMLPYHPHCEVFIFDTATPQYGGSGRSFNWALLTHYTGETPFLLSGGLGLHNIKEALQLKHPALKGFDFNSQLEDEAGFKNELKTQQLIKKIINENI